MGIEIKGFRDAKNTSLDCYLPIDEKRYDKEAAKKYKERINLTPENDKNFRIFEIPSKNLGITNRRIRVCRYNRELKGYYLIGEADLPSRKKNIKVLKVDQVFKFFGENFIEVFITRQSAKSQNGSMVVGDKMFSLMKIPVLKSELKNK